MKLLPILLCSVMFGQEPRVQPQSPKSHLTCRADGTYDIYGWNTWGISIGEDALPQTIVRDWPGFVTGDCSKWKPKPGPKPCHLAIIWPFDDQREESAMKVRICSTEEK